MLCSEKNQNYTIASLFYSQSKSNLQYVQQGFQSEMSLGHVTSEPQNLI